MWEQEITEENMASFVQDFLDDKLKATLKSGAYIDR